MSELICQNKWLIEKVKNLRKYCYLTLILHEGVDHKWRHASKGGDQKVNENAFKMLYM